MRMLMLILAFLAGYFAATWSSPDRASAQSQPGRPGVEIAGRTISMGMTISEIRAIYGERSTSARDEGGVQCVDLLTSETFGEHRLNNIVAGTVYFDRRGRVVRIVREWGTANGEYDLWAKLHSAIAGRLSISGGRANITIADRHSPDHEVSDLSIAFDDGRSVVLERDKILRDGGQPVVISVYEDFGLTK